MALFVLDLDDTLVNTYRDLQDDIANMRSLTLVEGAAEFLTKYGKQSIILSVGQQCIQQQKIASLYLAKLVSQVVIVLTPNERLTTLTAIAAMKKETTVDVVVVGDRVDQEIQMGNQLDLITVRMRLPVGKYSYNEPQHSMQKPDYTVSNFFELMQLPLNF
jgi:FMN phosphatase YigB (HAD superfamily)